MRTNWRSGGLIGQLRIGHVVNLELKTLKVRVQVNGDFPPKICEDETNRVHGRVLEALAVKLEQQVSREVRQFESIGLREVVEGRDK